MNDNDPLKKNCMTVFYLLDASGSMEGDKIGSLNEGMRESLRVLKKVSEDAEQPRVKVAILTFADDVVWKTPLPVELRNYTYEPIIAYGLTAFDGACKELASKLDGTRWLADDVGIFNPVIIAMSDGAPTDGRNDGFGEGLKILKENKFYKAALKVALSIDAPKDSLTFKNLEEFTGNKESVIPVTDVEKLKAVIKFVSYHSVVTGSKSESKGGTPKDTETEFVGKIKEAEEDNFPDVGDDDDDE